MEIQSIDFELPMTFCYELPSFFVRSCYDEYYQILMKLLKRYHFISITGTPGIFKIIKKE